MKNSNLVYLVFAFISFSACKKDKGSHVSESQNYSQLKVGNYWIYQAFIVDTMGNATETEFFDSCYIEDDTIINNHVYYKMVRPTYWTSSQMNVYYLRDSSHYIIDNWGKIMFSSKDFDNIFLEYYFDLGQTKKDTMFRAIQKMDNTDFITHTPAGTFNTLNVKATFYMNPSFARKIRHMTTKYSDKIGIVSESYPFFFYDPVDRERRLVRYKVN
jgi:hypothetical protein